MTITARSKSSASFTKAINAAVRFRTAVVLFVLLATALGNVMRVLTAPDQNASDEPVSAPIVMGSLMLYEALTLVWLFRRRDRSKPLPEWWMYSNAAIEALAPTALVFSIGLTSDVSLQGAALGPASHLYAIFIVLSILHVRLLLSLVAGGIAAIGLASVVVVSVVWETDEAALAMGLPRSLEGLSAVFVLLTGVTAGLVALKVRGYLESSVIEAERRMKAERDLQAAALIQQSLMPTMPPQVDGFEIVGWNRSADETGGDYFDWVPLDDGRFAICIADVTGHGLGPAMITCFCRAYARTALRGEDRLANAMSRLNSELVNDLGDGRFVTFAAVVVTPGQDSVLSVSAGHGPLLVLRNSSSTVESFGADALPLGVHGVDEDVDSVTHSLAEGDTFVLLTDGFFEWANSEGDQFGTARLQETLAKHRQDPPQQLIDGLIRDVESFTGGTPQPDDLTVVVIRRAAKSAKDSSA
ncbi:MAG: PP2C family protein-serine/threonine phosphatase [Planctomycetota bacterium]